MDFGGYFSIPNWLLVIIVIIVVYVTYMSWDYGIFKKMGVDGPKPTYVFGNIVFIMSKGVRESEKIYYQKYNRIWGHFETKYPVLFIGEPDLVKEILVKQFSNFPNRRTLGSADPPFDTSLSIVRDDHWKFLRTTLSPTFTGKKLKEMSPLVNDTCDLLLANLEDMVLKDEDVEVKKLCGNFTLDTIARTAFGIEVDCQRNPDDRFMKNTQIIFKEAINLYTIMILFYVPFIIPILKLFKIRTGIKPERLDYFRDMVKVAVKEREDNPGMYKDFLQLMLDTRKEDVTTSADSNRRGLSDGEILGNALMFFLAGYDSVATSIAFTLYSLAINPECCDKLIQEIDRELKGAAPTYDNTSNLPYMDMCLCETNRLYPTTSRIDREAANDTKVGRLKIQKGMVVCIPVAAMHMDPKFWPNPEQYDPERFTEEAKSQRHPFVYLPFGGGPRNCIGSRLALMEGKIALVRILQKYRPIRCSKTKVPLELKKIGFMEAVGGVWCKFERRA